MVKCDVSTTIEWISKVFVADICVAVRMSFFFLWGRHLIIKMEFFQLLWFLTCTLYLSLFITYLGSCG